MIYLMLLCGFILFFILICFALLVWNRFSHQILLGICIVSFAISAFFPMRYVLCNPFLKEQVSITALREKNGASFGTGVIIHYLDSNYSERTLENPVEGQWAWWNGLYRWFDVWEQQDLHLSDTIVMEIPVGSDRSITFSNGVGYGKVEIACLGEIQTIDLFNETEGLLTVKLPASLHDDYIRDLTFRAVAFAGMEILIILLITVIAVFLIKKTNWCILLKWKYEALVFLLSLVNVILMGWYPNIVDYPTSYYFMAYEGGFNSRGLTGALTMLLGGPYVGQKGLASFILVILVLTYLFESVLIVRLAKQEPDWRMGAFWVLLYLLSPFLFLQIFDDARPDLYLIILFLLGAILINKNRFTQLVPAICVLMILINETSSVFFVAPLLALIIYCFYKERQVGYLFSFISSVVFSCFTTLRVLQLNKGQLVSIDSVFAHMSMHTDAPLNYSAFAAEYKDSGYLVEEFAFEMGNQYHPNYELLVHSILFFILIIPYVMLFVIIWKAVYRQIIRPYADCRTSLICTKLMYWLLLLSSCGGVICMLMAYDYFRFTEFIMIATLASIFTLIRKEGITIKISDLYLFSPPKRDIPIVPFAILLYMKFWGTVNVWPTDTQILWALARILKGFLRMY